MISGSQRAVMFPGLQLAAMLFWFQLAVTCFSIQLIVTFFRIQLAVALFGVQLAVSFSRFQLALRLCRVSISCGSRDTSSQLYFDSCLHSSVSAHYNIWGGRRQCICFEGLLKAFGVSEHFSFFGGFLRRPEIPQF